MAVTPHERLAALADQVERVMRDLGAWSDPAPPLRPFNLPFAMDTMAFEHWLQLVLVPRMREIAAAREPLPASSGLAAHAVREFDGQDEMTPLVDVLRAIDDLCPAAPWLGGQPVLGARRLALGVALILLLTGWGVVAVMLTNRLAPALTFASPMVIQTFAGSVAPGADFQPLRLTVTALAPDEHAIRPSAASFTLLRSMRTMTRGPTAPLDFTMNERPTEAAVLDWLADHDVDEHGAPAHAAAAEALAVVGAAARARTVDALHVAAVTVNVKIRAEEILHVGAHTPQWAELTLLVILVLAGALPIAFVLVRVARRA